MYYNGDGTEQNYEKAYELLHDHKNKNSKELYLLALMNLHGVGVTQSPDTAIHYLQAINYKEERDYNQKEYASYKYTLGRLLLENQNDDSGWIFINAAAGIGHELLYQACAYAQGKYNKKRDIDNAMKRFDKLLKSKDDSCRIWAAYNKGVILSYGAFGYPMKRKEGLEILIDLRDHKKFKPAAPVIKDIYSIQ